MIDSHGAYSPSKLKVSEMLWVTHSRVGVDLKGIVVTEGERE